jgi:hypothetical protein
MSDRQGASADVKEAPREFRIFPAGDFMTDDGPHRMTRPAADALVAIFNARGNVMVIDHDHATTTLEAPPENRAAAGWIQKLEARGDGEVWAIGVEWDPMVEGWLLCNPPKVRYLSPWYSFKMVGDIAIPTRVNNVGLTNNPKTWHCWRLASLAAEKGRKGIGMDQQDLVLAGRTLLTLLALMGASNEALATWAKEQNAALTEALGENANAAMQAAGELEQEDDGAAAMSDEDKAKLVAALEEEAKKAASMSDEDKAKQAAAAQAVDDDTSVAASLAIIRNQELAKAANIKARDALIEKNLSIIPKTAVPLLRKASLATVASFVSDMGANARLPAKSPVAPKGVTTVKIPSQKSPAEQQVFETRVASMATKWKIKPKQLDTLRKVLSA